jgi:hypothetical protein
MPHSESIVRHRVQTLDGDLGTVGEGSAFRGLPFFCWPNLHKMTFSLNSGSTTDRVLPALESALAFAPFPAEFQRVGSFLCSNRLCRSDALTGISPGPVLDQLFSGDRQGSLGLAVHKKHAHRKGIPQLFLGHFDHVTLLLSSAAQLLFRQSAPFRLVAWSKFDEETIDWAKVGLGLPMNLQTILT